jgi:Mg2+-importing ATPase
MNLFKSAPRSTLRMRQSESSAWWLRPLDQCLAELAADIGGLSSAAAAERLARVGPNTFHDRPQRPLLLQFLARFTNPLVVILLTASLVSALAGEITSFVLITVLVLLSVVLDFVQEYRADRAAEQLRATVALRVSVQRDGAKTELPISQLVPGDVVLLCAGDLVPADARVLESRDFFVNQALLTGEPYPVEKHSGDLASGASELSNASNAVFMGSSVISGNAQALVIKTGRATSMGMIAEQLTRTPPPTAFDIGTRRFGLLIMRLTLLLVLFVLLINAFAGRPWLESFLFAVALAVGLTPELLPMVVSVTLARGALRMARQRVIVKRLAAIQNLGSMDVFCTDKTGTLTEAKIELAQAVDSLGRNSAHVLELAYLNSHFESGLKSPLDEAILAHAHIDTQDWRKLDEVPFDFERRRVSVLLERASRRILVLKGAPEDVLAICRRYERDGSDSIADLDTVARAQLRSRCDALLRDGMRVLGIAWREVGTDHPHALVSDETDLVFAGYAVFLDPPKESAAAALRSLAQSGVAVKIVTGDSELVTQHVCAQLGIPISAIVLGTDIARMDDFALRVQVENANLFCRVNPSQKERVIRALKARGHVVGYLGDGINDAPSLHSADVGLSVDSAVDVAKAAADMILLKRDLHVLHDAVPEGRRTFTNVMKYLLMGTSSNFGNMFSMAGAALFLPFLPMLPAQILLNNALYDLSEIAIPLDRVDSDALARPCVWDMRFLRNFMLVVGPVSSLFDFLTFFVLLKVLSADAPLFQTGWFVESLATQVLVIFVLRTRGNPLRSRPDPRLVATSIGMVIIGTLLPFTPLAPLLGFVALPPSFLGLLAAMVVAYVLLVEIIKRQFYRWAEAVALVKPSTNTRAPLR